MAPNPNTGSGENIVQNTGSVDWDVDAYAHDLVGIILSKPDRFPEGFRLDLKTALQAYADYGRSGCFTTENGTPKVTMGAGSIAGSARNLTT